MSGWMAYWRCPSICGHGQLSREPVSNCKILDKICKKKTYHSSLYLYAMPIKPDSIFSKCFFSLKGSQQKSAVCIHSAQLGGQAVLWSTPYKGDLDWCWGWSRDGANGSWQSVFLQLTLLNISIQGQQLDLLLQLSLPSSRDGAGPQPLNAKGQVSCARSLPPRQGWPRLQPPPQVLFLGGTHALEFAGQPGGLILDVFCTVS